MKDIFKKATNAMLCSSIIAFFVGLLMVINPTMPIKTIGIIAAIYFILHGIAMILFDSTTSKYYIPFDGLLSGVLSIVIGVVLFSRPDVLTAIFALAVGLWIAVSSINNIRTAIVFHGDKETPWIWMLVLGAIDLIIGILVIFNPFSASMAVTVFAGIMIMIHSALGIIDVIMIKKDAKKLRKAIEKKVKEFKAL